MSTRAPDYAEPRIGWRVWDVVEDDGTLKLRSLLHPAIWQPREEAVAHCRRSLASLPWERMPLHLAPAFDCVCGIYGVASPVQARPFLGLPGRDSVIHRVLGSVAMWGRVVEGELGLRSERGYPKALFVPLQSHGARAGWRRRRPRADDVAAALEVYGVPVELTTALPASTDFAGLPA